MLKKVKLSKGESLISSIGIRQKISPKIHKKVTPVLELFLRVL